MIDMNVVEAYSLPLTVMAFLVACSLLSFVIGAAAFGFVLLAVVGCYNKFILTPHVEYYKFLRKEYGDNVAIAWALMGSVQI